MRKGQAEFLEWFPRLILLFLAVIIIVLLVNYFASREVNAGEVHRETYLTRLMYDDIIMYKDVTGRVYPGTVDFSKFTETKIDDTYGVTGKISSVLHLSGCKEATIYHDKETYEFYEGFARFGTKGPGGATIQEALFPVTIIENDNRCAGTLNITIVRPNS